jgi:ABC-type branched-subunit amino acid transport system permease subunit
LGFGEIVRLTLNLLQFPGGKMFPGEKIGGCTGISFTEFPSDVWPNLPESLWGNNPELFARYSSWWVVWIFVIVTWIILLNIKKSSFGRAMMCIREDEIAAQSMGINIWKYKILAFLIGAAFAGLAGALFFHKEVTIAPSQFQLMVSIEILLMVVLGGLGSLTGSIGGAILLGITPFILRRLEIAEYTQLIYALLLIVLIRLMPNGILGMKEMPGWLSGKINSKKQRESS